MKTLSAIDQNMKFTIFSYNSKEVTYSQLVPSTRGHPDMPVLSAQYHSFTEAIGQKKLN